MGPLVDGHYSLLGDHSLRNVIVWPLIPWAMYDVQQRRWVDIPTFAQIQVRPDEFLLLRAKDTLNIDSEQMGAMDTLILQLESQYKPIPEIAWNVPQASVDPPVTPAHPKVSEKTFTPRWLKRKHSEEPSSASVTRNRAKRMKTRTDDVVGSDL